MLVAAGNRGSSLKQVGAFAHLLRPRFVSVEAGAHIVSRNGKRIHPVWLRERCLSPKSVQPETLQSFIQPHDLPMDLGVSSAQITTRDGIQTLHVTFTDGHRSTFSVEALEAEIVDFTARGVQRPDISLPPKKLWDGISGAALVRVPHISLINEGPQIVLELTRAILANGHAIIENVPCRDMEGAAVAKMLSGFPGNSVVRPTNWGPVFNVRSEPEGQLKDLAYTSEALPPHVDNPYRNPNPGFQLLHCLENMCSTGESIAVDGFHVAEQLRREDPAYFDILCKTQVRWENDGGDGSTSLIFYAAHIDLNQATGEITQIRYSPKSGGFCSLISDYTQIDLFYRARRRLAELLNAKSNMVTFQLRKGDLWIFNNLRVLHGRASFNPSEGLRHLQGCYMDMDAIEGAYFRAKYALANRSR